MTKFNVVVVDDDQSIVESLSQWLELADFSVHCFDRAADALAFIQPDFNGAVICDVKMPEIDGLAFLEQIHKDIPVIMITGHGGIAMAVDAMKAGAYDFIEKPFKPERLIEKVAHACDQRSQTLLTVTPDLNDLHGIEADIIGQSESIQQLRKQILALAKVNTDIVIHGETGCGKELVARCLHKYSLRHQKPFVAINVAALPENLIESELFGHEAGAFTGANKSRPGKFEFADGGSLLLDEIESMPMYFQIRILRVLQEREIVRVGSHDVKNINVRIIAATKKDLREAVKENTFREDLYYRLLVSEIRIPPLRERKEDILPLFRHFLRLASEKNALKCPDLTTDECLALEMHEWPGNVRELKNTAERYLMANTIDRVQIQELLQIGSQHLSLDASGEASLSQRLEQVERMLIEAELIQAKGNIKQVMASLDLPRRTLNLKMQKYNLQRENYLKV